MTGEPLPSIVEFFVCDPDCPRCLGSGYVCEDHPDRAWGEGDGCCGAAGMPCVPELRTGGAAELAAWRSGREPDAAPTITA